LHGIFLTIGAALFEAAMNEQTVAFVRSMVARLPNLSELFEEHVKDNFGEVLPHVFLAMLRDTFSHCSLLRTVEVCHHDASYATF
jgi:hypothetical protein